MRILTAVAVFALSAPAFAGTSQPGALSRCAKLLPEGKDYTLKVEGNLRHDGNGATVKRTAASALLLVLERLFPGRPTRYRKS